jgi:DMSO/TMAO reductase YedYZ molybdopterin-dependent catalytic subunit
VLKKLRLRQKIKRVQNDILVPPGQHVTDKFPVLTFGPIPRIDLDTWRFRVFGLVEEELTLDWTQFMTLQKTVVDAEFHCVTQWSRLENRWEGVAFKDLMKVIKPQSKARFVMAHCYGGYTTNLALDVLMEEDVLFATCHDGEILSLEHGGPLRLVVPKRYAWKSAKWVNGLEFMVDDSPGFWEARGYNMHADPFKEERFSD